MAKLKFNTIYCNVSDEERINYENVVSLTDASFKEQTNVDYILSTMGHVPQQAVYGVQDYTTRAEFEQTKIELVQAWNRLSEAEKRRFGNIYGMLNIANYTINEDEHIPIMSTEKESETTNE